MEYAVPFNTTDFVQASLDDVIATLFLTFLLVVSVVFIFLGNWRATIIPTVAIPVSLIGTFAVLLALGMSLNTISLFALVLAIGIVVDDAIVVVENVERIIAEEGLPPKEATAKAMEQITSPVIATTLVLLAVFVPTIFMVYWNLLVPRSRPDSMSHIIERHRAEAERLHGRDLAFVYGDFHVESVH